jgi:signal transduction histidine kinase
MRVMHTYDEESLESIDLEVDRLTRLVSDLLFISQAETGNLPLILEPIALDELLIEVIEEMKVLSEGQHTITIDNIEPVVISGDRDRLKQVFLNLGSNSVKYSPEGLPISLSLEVVEGWVVIHFKDQGPGISKEDLSHIFERFYRGDKSRSRSKKYTGYGLGLPIAYWIVRNHGGRIEVDSKLGEGSTFSVWLLKSTAQ